MTTLQSRRLFRSHPSTRGALTFSLCAFVLSLTPLAGEQQPAPVKTQPAPIDHQKTPVEKQGPVLGSSEVAQGAMLLHFTNAVGGLLLRGSGRGAFEIAGADHVWFPAEAHLVNGVVVVSTSLVQQPKVVRYSWSRLDHATLFNSAGVPAAPFSTDK